MFRISLVVIIVMLSGCSPFYWSTGGANVAEAYETPLHLAARRGDADAVALALRRGEDMYQCTNYFRTPFVWAVLHGQREIVELFLRNNFRIDHPCVYQGSKGWNGLWALAEDPRTDAELLKMALLQGVDVDAFSGNADRPALFAAIRRGNVNVVRTLLEAGANPNYEVKLFYSREPTLWRPLDEARLSKDRQKIRVVESLAAPWPAR